MSQISKMIKISSTLVALAGAVSAVVCTSLESNADSVSRALVPPAGNSLQAVHAPGGTRKYLLHVPASPPRRFGRARPYPLLLLLHGSGADGGDIAEESRMDSVADRYHVVVAYPNGAVGLGAGSDWNAGECCGYAQRQNIDDVGFLRAIMSDLPSRLPIDTSRIYVAGFSDGGRMAYRAACEMSGTISAIAVVSGSLQYPLCKLARPVSLLAIHGTADDDVPFDDNIPGIKKPLAGPPSIPSSVRFWSLLQHCKSYSERTVTPGVTRGEFNGCNHSDIALLKIAGGRHNWPTDNATNSDVLLAFLLAHHR